MNKIPKWLKITGGVLLTIMILGGVAGSTNKNTPSKPDNASKTTTVEPKPSVAVEDRCLDVAVGIITDIESGATTKGITLRGVKAVKSKDFSKAYFVSADMQGTGLEGTNDIVTFFTNDIAITGDMNSVNDMANQYYVWPDARKASFKATMDNDGAKDSVACVKL